MEVGDRVIYYIHEASDIDSRTSDRLAFVTNVVDDNCVDVIVFPPLAPPEWYRVCRFDPDDLGQPVGVAHWRAAGDKPPDFTKQTRFANDPEWHNLRQKHREEWDRARVEDRPALQDKHRKEWTDLYAKLEKKAGPKK